MNSNRAAEHVSDKPEGGIVVADTTPAQSWGHDAHGVLYFRSCNRWFRARADRTIARYVQERKAALVARRGRPRIAA